MCACVHVCVCVLRESNCLKTLISLAAAGLFCRRQLVNMPVCAWSVFVWGREGATVCIVLQMNIVQQKANRLQSEVRASTCVRMQNSLSAHLYQNHRERAAEGDKDRHLYCVASPWRLISVPSLHST